MRVPPDEVAALTEIEVRAPVGPELAAAGPVLAAAFVDDPVWTAVGPRRRGHRTVTNRAVFWGIVRAAVKHGARVRVALDPDSGAVAGATIAYEPGAWPMPDSSFAWELGWAIIAGPLPLYRGLRDDRAMREQHVDYPHMYLWFVGVDPSLHGTGVGRVLMAELHQHSDDLRAPTYLETGTGSNVGFYESLGYSVLGEIAMPSGAHMWRMQRPAQGG
jgi:GNAT superfamily N-acetyltransferase